MRIYNRLIIALAVVFFIIDIALAFLGQDDIAVYFIFNAIAYFVIVLAFTALDSRSKSALNNLGVLIIAGFIFSAGFKLYEIIR
jgi:hypothetical protein